MISFKTKNLPRFLAWILMACLLTIPAGIHAQENMGIVAHSEEYFPDRPGNRWQYRGQITEGPLQTIDHKLFTNESKVTGTRSLKGTTVTVFHDSNAGNHGPSDSFYRRDAAGIVYHGSEPGTPLEQQLIPYQIVRFPMKISASFLQFDRKKLDFGSDVDGDGTNEQADVEGRVTVVAQETVVVPAGSFPNAVKVEARMQLRIQLSSINQTALGTDVMSAWFVKGVGLVKYIERQELPPLRNDRGFVTEIMEELEEFEVKPASASLGWREAPPQSILADDSGDHELREIVLPSRLRTDS